MQTWATRRVLWWLPLGVAGCSAGTHVTPYIGETRIELASLVTCPQLQIAGVERWRRSYAPDDSTVSVLLPMDATVTERDAAGQTRHQWDSRSSQVSLSITWVDFDRVQDPAAGWPDGDGPFRSRLDLGCHDCMFTQQRCQAMIAGRQRFVALGRMTGWDDAAVAYATWQEATGRWVIVEARAEEADAPLPLAMLYGVQIND